MKDDRLLALQALNVSRETADRLDVYADLLFKWTARINLVSPATLSALWTRHFLDSAQLFGLAPEDTRTWVDLGSGGGFPGLIVAILAAEAGRQVDVTLIEADQRKAAFLRTVARETGTGVRVLSERIEVAEPQSADVVSARALAPLETLLGFVHRHIAADGVALLQKGANHGNERMIALERWRFDCETLPSKTDSDAVVMRIGGIERV